MTDGQAAAEPGTQLQAPGEAVRAAGGRAALEWAVSFTEAERLIRFAEGLRAADTDWPERLGLGGSGPGVLAGGRRPTRIHFGNEFCQRLLPSPAVLDSALGAAAASGLAFGFVLPVLTDAGLETADRLLQRLPEGTEVSVNDWGLMRRLSRRFPGLRPTAGRLLCRMLKEPRAPSAAYLQLGGRGFMTPGLERLLDRFGVERLEIDVPPFARGQDLYAPRGRLSVHAPFGFVTTGRICRIGNLHRPMEHKFAAGHTCARECLAYWCELTPGRGPDEAKMSIFQRGNTIFYRHTTAMDEALAGAIAAGSIDRLVISGDWHADRRAPLGA